VIVIRSDGVLVRLDPRHGGEILDLVDLATGRQLLGRPPFPSLEPLTGFLDEDSWTERYRGGWQTVTPNAGNPCAVAGEQHGFHGRASSDRWDVVDANESSATLRWAGHGLEVTRRVAAQADGLAVETDWRAVRDRAALVAVEHISLGTELIVPSATVRLPGGVAFELSETSGPVRGPATAPGWPDVLLLDGSTERGDRFSVAGRGGRFLGVESLPEGWYEVVNDLTGQGVRVEWDVAALPHVWIWWEARTSGGRWREQAEMLAIEPASVPHSLGLARALEEGQAVVLAEDERFATRLSVRPLRERAAT
jgi:hypothetical protein